MGALVLSTATELVRSDAIDAVVVTSATTAHAEAVLACITAKRPVFVEKPLAQTAQECLDIVSAEMAHGERLVQVGFMRRFDPGYAAIKASLDAGELGVPLLMHNIHRNRTAPTATSAGLIRESVIHEIDAIRWLLAQEIQSAQVALPRPSPHAPQGVRDPQLALFRTTGGVLVDVECFANSQYGYDVRCEVVGSTGTAAIDGHGDAIWTRVGSASRSVHRDWRSRFGPAYDRELQAWVDSVAAGEATGPSSWDGYAATRVAESTVSSLATERIVAIEMIERPALYA